MANQKTDHVATLGAAALILTVSQIAVGIALGTRYISTTGGAHKSVQNLHFDPTFGILQGFHYWASAVLIVVSGLAVAAGLWSGSYIHKSQTQFVSNVFLFVFAIAFQLTGNILPWDRHAVQTAAIEGSIAGRVPGIGRPLMEAMLGGKGVSQETLTLWYDLHRIVLPGLFVVLAIVLISSYMKEREGEPNWAAAAGGLAIAFLTSFVLRSPLGSAATAADAGKFDALASWYTLPAHAMLVWTDGLMRSGGWLGAVLLPGAIFAAILGIGVLKVSQQVAQWFLVGATLLFSGITLLHGGQPAPLTGKRDPASIATIAKQNDIKDPQLAAMGRRVFNSNSCVACHGQDGKIGTTGPSLAESYKKRSDIFYYVTYIKNPKEIKPGSTMPGFPTLKPEELRALAEFLRFPNE
jgi:mono/diheme cytochrome c family protein